MGATSFPDPQTRQFESGTQRLDHQSASLSRRTLTLCGLLLALQKGATSSPGPQTRPFEYGMRILDLINLSRGMHADSVWSVAYSPDGRHIISGSRDKTIRMWDAETGLAVGKLPEGHTHWVSPARWAPDHFRILRQDDSNMGCRDRICRRQASRGATASVWSVAYSPDGRHLIPGSSDKTIRMWDADTGSAVGKPLEGHTDSVWSVAYSPDGRHITSGSLDKMIRMWDAESGAAVGKPLKGHTHSVLSVAYSPDGHHII